MINLDVDPRRINVTYTRTLSQQTEERYIKGDIVRNEKVLILRSRYHTILMIMRGRICSRSKQHELIVTRQEYMCLHRMYIFVL